MRFSYLVCEHTSGTHKQRRTHARKQARARAGGLASERASERALANGRTNWPPVRCSRVQSVARLHLFRRDYSIHHHSCRSPKSFHTLASGRRESERHLCVSAHLSQRRRRRRQREGSRAAESAACAERRASWSLAKLTLSFPCHAQAVCAQRAGRSSTRSPLTCARKKRGAHLNWATLKSHTNTHTHTQAGVAN